MIRIVTDSTCDLTDELIREHDLSVIPVNVIIEGKTYADGVELSKQDFYEKMDHSKTLPSTAQASPSLFQRQFQKILDQGDDVYYVGLSSTFSGTIQSARIGRDMLDEPERVTIFDSLTVSLGQGGLALEASKLAREGKSAEEITVHLTALRERQHIIFTAGGLDNLKKSGRINNLSFLFGSLLNIKPIFQIDKTGVVQVFDKVRGKKNAALALIRYLQENKPDDNYDLALLHTSEPDLAASFKAILEEYGFTKSRLFELSGVIGTHVGRGTYGVMFFSV